NVWRLVFQCSFCSLLFIRSIYKLEDGWPVLERFPLLVLILIVWADAHLLTASGANRHRPLPRRPMRADLLRTLVL
ncbi:unnamed protein product, partial [Musa textilis]